MNTLTCPSIDQRVDYVINHHPHLKRDRVHFKTQKGHVTLSGQVNSYFEKQMAQETLLRIDGVESVDNHLEVMRRRVS